MVSRLFRLRAYTYQRDITYNFGYLLFSSITTGEMAMEEFQKAVDLKIINKPGSIDILQSIGNFGRGRLLFSVSALQI